MDGYKLRKINATVGMFGDFTPRKWAISLSRLLLGKDKPI